VTAARILLSAALLCPLQLGADSKPALHPFALYDAGGSPLVFCQIDTTGNVSACSLNGSAKLDDLVQRMVEQMKAARYAKFRTVEDRLIAPSSLEVRDR
jgi:hypothetical protein